MEGHAQGMLPHAIKFAATTMPINCVPYINLLTYDYTSIFLSGER